VTIFIFNGPNLNLVGRREPEVYGKDSLDSFLEGLVAAYADRVNIELVQTNHEGQLVDRLQEVGFRQNTFIILNAGALTHTSLSLGDCVRAISAPVVEVHISNVQAREAFRQNSYIAPAAVGSISGLGLEGYRLAIDWFLRKQDPPS